MSDWGVAGAAFSKRLAEDRDARKRQEQQDQLIQLQNDQFALQQRQYDEGATHRDLLERETRVAVELAERKYKQSQVPLREAEAFRHLVDNLGVDLSSTEHFQMHSSGLSTEDQQRWMDFLVPYQKIRELEQQQKLLRVQIDTMEHSLLDAKSGSAFGDTPISELPGRDLTVTQLSSLSPEMQRIFMGSMGMIPEAQREYASQPILKGMTQVNLLAKGAMDAATLDWARSARDSMDGDAKTKLEDALESLRMADQQAAFGGASSAPKSAWDTLNAIMPADVADKIRSDAWQEQILHLINTDMADIPLSTIQEMARSRDARPTTFDQAYEREHALMLRALREEYGSGLTPEQINLATAHANAQIEYFPSSRQHSVQHSGTFESLIRDYKKAVGPAFQQGWAYKNASDFKQEIVPRETVDIWRNALDKGFEQVPTDVLTEIIGAAYEHITYNENNGAYLPLDALHSRMMFYLDDPAKVLQFHQQVEASRKRAGQPDIPGQHRELTPRPVAPPEAASVKAQRIVGRSL